MSTLAIVLIVVFAVLAVFFVGGLAYAARRSRRDRGRWRRHIADADRALEVARASDRGWDRARIEAVGRAGLADHRPELRARDLHLVLVDDRPGVEEDRAHLVADAGDGEVRIVLSRRDGDWEVERVD